MILFEDVLGDRLCYAGPVRLLYPRTFFSIDRVRVRRSDRGGDSSTVTGSKGKCTPF